MRWIVLAGILCVLSFALLDDAVAENVQCQEGAFTLGDSWSTFRTRIKGYCVNWNTDRFIGYLANGDSLIKPLGSINDLKDSRGHRVVLVPTSLTSAPTDSLYEVLKLKPLDEMTDREHEYFMLKRKAGVSGATAQDHTVFRVGCHGAYSSGGDVQKPKFTFGAQCQLSLNRNFAIELAASRYSDEYEEEGVSTDLHVTTVGLSLVMTVAGSEPLSLYGLGGLDYNFPSVEVTYAPYDVEVDVQNEIGYHVGGGLRSTAIATKNVEGFIEYRYTRLGLDGKMTVSHRGSLLGSAEFGGSSNFGLVKFGVNYRF